MASTISKTGYSVTGGGAKGYVNIGGWNTTLTDVTLTGAETVGIRRQEGGNEYMYIAFGTAGASKGNFLSPATCVSDANGICPPIQLTANGVVSTGTICKGMAIATVGTGSAAGCYYGWALVRGVATGWCQSDAAATQAVFLEPSVTTANLVNCSGTLVGALTAVGRVIGPDLGTGTASAGATAGVLIYWNFKAI